MTFLQLQQQVAANLARTDKTEQIKTWINWTLRHIARQHDFRQLDTRASVLTTSGKQLCVLPDDLKTLKNVRCDKRLLVEVHPLEIEELQRNTQVEVRSRPRVYAQTADSGKLALLFFPTPDAAYTVDLVYSRWPAEMSADGAVPDISNCDDAIIAGATWHGFVHLQQPEDANAWWAVFRNAISNAIDVDKRRVRWTPGALRYPAPYLGSGDPALDPFVKRV